MHHPWRELRDRGDHVRLLWTEFNDGRVGATVGNDIYLDRRLLQSEKRCAIQHEQMHIEFGHDGCQSEKDEARVRKLTAQRLIHRDDLIRAMQWAMSLEEAADELWVTPEVLRDRLHFMHPSEKLLIAAAVEAGKESHAD